MKKSETLQLFAEIVRFYPNATMFANPNVSQIEAWTEALGDMTLDNAIKEVRRHVLSNKYPPTVSDIAHKRKYNSAIDGYEQRGISDEAFERLVVLDQDGWHNGGQYHNGGIYDTD